jgi:uncharacterized protein (TIGR00251 family)
VDAPRTRVRLRVSPGSRRTAIVGRHGEAWKVRVTAPAEGGRANDAVVRLLGETLAVPPSSVNVVAGHSARDKVVELAALGADETDRRLAGGGKDVSG